MSEHHNKRERDREELLRTIVEYGYDDPTHAAQRLGSAETTNVVAAALTIAAQRKFGEKPDPQAVRDYVAGLADEGIDPATGEALILGMLDNPDLLDKVQPDAFIHAGVLISYSIRTEQPLDAAARAAFMAETEALVAELEN